MELLQMSFKVLVHKGGPVITEVLLHDHSKFITHLVVVLLGFQRVMGVQAGLQLHVIESSGMIAKDATTFELCFRTFLPISVEQTSKWVAVEVVD